MTDEETKTPLEKAEELNDMDRDMTSAEADFHDRILKELRNGRLLRPKDASRLEVLYVKYFAPKEEEEERREASEEETEDDVDF